MGTLNPSRGKKKRMYRGGGRRRDDTFDHGFVQNVAEGKISYGLIWKVKRDE